MTAEAFAVSVVIPAHNSLATLPQQLDALARQQCTESFEIIVVDNNSTDGTSEWLAKRSHNSDLVRTVRATEKNSPGYARNIGVQSSNADVIIFCDADDVVAEHFVETASHALQRADVVMGRIDYTHLNSLDLQASRGSTTTDGVGWFDGIFPYVVSACLAVRRSAFELAGGFDEELRVGQDVDFGLRLWRAGIEVIYEPNMLVHYRLRDSMSRTFRQAKNYGRVRSVIRRRLRSEGITGVGHVKWRNVGWLLRHLPDLRLPDARFRWLNVAGNLWGEIKGELPWSREPIRR